MLEQENGTGLQGGASGSLKKVECPYCGGRMLKSRRNLLQGMTHVYWQKPWGSIFKMDEPVVTMACVNCGAVMLALRDSNKVAREWSSLSDDEKRRLEEDEG